MPRNRSQPESSRVPIDEWQSRRSAGEAGQPVSRPSTDITLHDEQPPLSVYGGSGVLSPLGMDVSAMPVVSQGYSRGVSHNSDPSLAAFRLVLEHLEQRTGAGMPLRPGVAPELGSVPHSADRGGSRGVSRGPSVPDSSDNAGSGERKKPKESPHWVRRIGMTALVLGVVTTGVNAWRNGTLPFIDGEAAATVVTPSELEDLQERLAPGEIATLTNYPVGMARMKITGEVVMDTTPETTDDEYLAVDEEDAPLAMVEIPLEDIQVLITAPAGEGEGAAVTQTAEGGVQVDMSKVTVSVVVPPENITNAPDPAIFSGGEEGVPGGAFGATSLIDIQKVNDLYDAQKANLVRQAVRHGVDALFSGDALTLVTTTVKQSIVDAMGLDATNVTFVGTEGFPANQPGADYLAGIEGFTPDVLAFMSDGSTALQARDVVFNPVGGN